MANTRWWTAGALSAMVVIVAFGWSLGIDPRLTEARLAEDERVGVEAQNAAYEKTLVKLEALAEDLPALSTQLEALTAAIPADAQISTLLGQLNELAAQSSVELTSVTTGVPARFQTLLPEPVPTAETAETAEPAAGDDAGVPAPTPAAEAPDNFIVVPIEAAVQGDRLGVLNFVNKVQYGTRLFVVNQLEVAYDEEVGGRVTIRGFVYVLTDPLAQEETEPADGG